MHIKGICIANALSLSVSINPFQCDLLYSRNRFPLKTASSGFPTIVQTNLLYCGLIEN